MDINSLIQELSGMNEIEQMEKILKRFIQVKSLRQEEYALLLNRNVVKRHLSLQSIVNKDIENAAFEDQRKISEKESFFKKLLIGIGLGPS